MKQQEKREIPSMVRNFLAFDVYLTQKFVKSVEKYIRTHDLKIHYKVLEISCHGLPWIASLLAFIWILNSKNLYQMQVNLLMGLLLDILIIAFLKAVTRRRRPAVNDDPFTMGPDKYSFPSGHASRAMMVLYFFLYLWPLPIICIPPLLVWVSAICLSRLLLRRHHLLDIGVGLFVGYLEGALVGYMYLAPQTCLNLVSWITDERMDGAEYDV